MKKLFLFLTVFLWCAQAQANTCVAAAGAAGNWTATTAWTACGGVAPTAADNAQITAITTSLTIDAGAVARSADFTGFTGTLTQGATGTLTLGDATAGLSNIALKLVAGATYAPDPASTITFVSGNSTQQTVTSGGYTLGNITFNAVIIVNGNYALTDNTTLATTSTFTLTAGTLHTDGAADNSALTHSWGAFVSTTNTSGRILTLGTSTIAITGGNWTISGTGAITFSGASSTISLTEVSATDRTFTGGSKTYNILNITGGGSGHLSISGNNTFAKFPQVTGGTKSLYFSAFTTTTITDGTNGFGNGTNVITMTVPTAGSFTFTTSGGTVVCDYLSLSKSTAAGTIPFYAGAHSTNGGSNINWKFTGLPHADLVTGGSLITNGSLVN